MAVCDLCGAKSGIFQARHPACAVRVIDAQKSLRELVFDGTLAGRSHSYLESEAKRTAAASRVPFDYLRESLLQGANDAATELALRSPLTEEELSRLVNILNGFGLDAYRAEWARRRWFGMPFVAMSHTLWQVLHGITPWCDSAGRMEFNLHSGEVPVFTAGKVTFAEERTISTHARPLGGLSVPFGQGIYYHLGTSQGNQVSGLMPIDVGEMLITTQALYFGGQKKTLRIPLAHVLRYQSYADAVGVCESHGVSKIFVPDFSGMDTGWFFFNLLSALSTNLR